MSDNVQSLVDQHRNSGIVIDANLLLLYFVGLFDPKEISRFKRTKIFTQEDYQLLVFVLREFRKVITTPNILTEVNSLSNQLAENKKLSGYFDRFAQEIELLTETYLPSKDLSRGSEFKRFGLTDAGIFSLGKTGHLILTVDFRLAGYLESQKIDVLNFNHVRKYLLG